MYRMYDAVDKQFANIHRYPAFKVANCAAAAPVAEPWVSRACLMSAQAAITELNTMRPNEKSAMDETAPPNQSTSPYAIRMMVRFLNIVYTGIERYRRAQVLV